MNIKNLKKILKTSYKIKRPVLALSSPGIGKSSVVYQVAAELGREYREEFGVIEIRAATSNPAELADIKYIVNGEVTNAIQGWLPTQEKVDAGLVPKRGFIFCDEMADGGMATQSALQQLLLDRRLGSARLAKGWATTGASNRTSDKAAAGRLSTALINRCIVVTIDPDTDVFLEWGADNDLHYAIHAFCKWRPVPWTFDPNSKADNPAFCSPRSFHILSDVLHEDPEPDYELIVGTIGDATGSEFAGFLKMMNELPDLNAIIKDPERSPVPRQTDVAIATMFALMHRANKDNIVNIATYLTRNQVELAVMAIKDLGKKDRSIATIKAVRDWMTDSNNVNLLTMA